MKPIKLSMTAFGPYRDEEIIDFMKLEDNQIFVISGPTGAGKTTIFDGICFALYGSVSGEERENAGNVRSDFADDTLHTAIELVFDMKNKRYRILRQLAHIKKGNKTATGDKTEFVEITENGEEPILDSHKIKDLNNKLEEIIGLTQDQFKQIVMLPQGEFRKLLTSDSKNKGDILRKIFKTENFKRMADRLKDKKDYAEKELQLVQNEQAIYISQISESFDQRPSELFEVLAKTFKSTSQIIEALQLEKIFYKDQLIPLKEQQVKQQFELDIARKKYTNAEHFNQSLSGYKAAELRLQQLEILAPDYLTKEQRIAKAHKAEHIIPYEQSYRKIRQQHSQLTTEAADALQAIEKTTQLVEQAQQQFNEANSKEQQIEKLKNEMNEWQKILPMYEELTKLKAKFAEITTTTLHAEKNLKQNEQQFMTLQKALPEEEQRFASLQSQTANIDALQTQFYTLEKVAVQLDSRQSAIKTIADNEIAIANEKRILQQKQADFERLENAWLSNQASVLAAQLVAGEACPVCGSTTHESSTIGIVDMTVNRQDLQIAQNDVKRVEQNVYSLQIAIKNAQQQSKNATDCLAEFKTIKFDETTIHETIYDLKRQVTDKIQLKKNCATLEEKIHRMRQQLEQNRMTLQNLEKAVGELQYERREIELLIQEKTKLLPVQFATQQEVIAAIKSASSALQNFQLILKKSIEQLDNTKHQQTIAVTASKAKQQQLASVVLALAESEDLFKAKVLEAGFMDGSAYITARVDPQILESLKEDLLQYKNECYAKQQQITDDAQLYANKEPFNLVVLQENIDLLSTEFEAVATTIRKTEQIIQMSERIENQLQATNDKMAILEKRAGHIIKLYDVLAGKNNLKISFERYLQIEYLEQIIHAANERLLPLSNGQYRLLRSERLDGNGKQSGLSLDVYDTYTGQERDVKTLSGGEQFNASLCLALGMSDIIQSFKGNVHMDTMFIDEGFGTLDEEALSKAIDTLVELQKTGRMIGIISHVSELKDTIPATLEVNKTKEGYSHSRFVIK